MQMNQKRPTRRRDQVGLETERQHVDPAEGTARDGDQLQARLDQPMHHGEGIELEPAWARHGIVDVEHDAHQPPAGATCLANM